MLEFCGTIDDPLMHPDFLDFIKFAADFKKFKFIIHTNGSLRNKSYWKSLAEILKETDHRILFSIDGLEDTHHLYRIGTNFNLIVKNAKTFIDHGGNAEWHYIKFKHNQHQVDAAKELSFELGFKKFSVKMSKRNARPFPVVDKQGNFLYNIEQPSDSTIKFVGKTQIQNHQNWENAEKINCVSIKDKELYIDAHYQLSPCCMIAAFLYTNYNVELYKKYNLFENDSILEEGEKVRQQVLEFPRFNVLEMGLKRNTF